MRLAVVGGGAAGFFGAITCAESQPGSDIIIFEKGSQLLQKVRISGGGRCNVTHACFDARELVQSYPRGQKELIGPYHRFQAEDTVRWFKDRGVALKTEADGRMFPVTDSSDTIVQCLLEQTRRCGITIRANCGVESIRRTEAGFVLSLPDKETCHAERVLLATGGCRTPALGALAASLGHTLQPPVPSLFTFHVNEPWVRSLAGVSIPFVKLTVNEGKLVSQGPLLFTHWGLSGPAILRLSAWGARILHEKNYQFLLHVNWCDGKKDEEIDRELIAHAKKHSAKLVVNSTLPPIPIRLWQALMDLASVPRDKRWSAINHPEKQNILNTLARTEFRVSGKSLNKDEFVTCGGITLSEVNFKTMESKLCPGLYFAGELLDIDGITGGFNFQAAWTTGWIAGQKIAESFG